MARPLPSGKQSVNLASGEVRASRIRRDPPQKTVEKVTVPADEREPWVVAVGVLAFALAIFVIILGVSAYTGRSPREYIVHM